MSFTVPDLKLHNDREQKILKWIEYFSRLSEGQKVTEFKTWIQAANKILAEKD